MSIYSELKTIISVSYCSFAVWRDWSARHRSIRLKKNRRVFWQTQFDKLKKSLKIPCLYYTHNTCSFRLFYIRAFRKKYIYHDCVRKQKTVDLTTINSIGLYLCTYAKKCEWIFCVCHALIIFEIKVAVKLLQNIVNLQIAYFTVHFTLF